MFASLNGAQRIALSALFAGVLFVACQGGNTNDGSKGGEGGSNEGGSGRDNSGGASTSQGGNGGKSNTGGGQGVAGSGGASPVAGMGGGAGGMNMTGTGGVNMAGTGGASMCTVLSSLAGKKDPEINPNITFCEPTCIFRPNWPGHHACGPEGSVLKAVTTKTAGFCGDPNNQDGVFQVEPGVRLYPEAYNQALASGGVVNSPVAGVVRAYLPGGQAGYDQAQPGQVAVTIWTGIMSGAEEYARNIFKVENIHEHLVQKKELPYTIAIFMNDDLNGEARTKQLKEKIFPALIKKWPKISTDPNYRAIVGQSTAGANAFDTIWLGTDVIAKGIGGSPSFACFTCMANAPGIPDRNLTYRKEIEFCPARPIRWSGTVGTCDIYGTRAERIVAGCPGDDPGSRIDSSGCEATWPVTNMSVSSALEAKKTPYQLFVIKDITCKM